MIHKYQNIYGISYVIVGNLKNINEDLKKLMNDIAEDKKIPFSSVYVRMPAFIFQKFMDHVRETSLTYKEIENRHEMFLIKF